MRTFPHAIPATWHILAPEYPPQLGGVADYTACVASALREAGDLAHVWCPAARDLNAAETFVHRSGGNFSPVALKRIGKELDRFPAPRNVLVQWVPHGYGYRSMNVPFCLWLWQRARSKRDRVLLMVHEPFLAFREGSWKQDAAAAVHRLMILVLLRAAEKVWVSTPEWGRALRPFLPNAALPVEILPVINNIPVVQRVDRASLRVKYAQDGELLVGHFGTHGTLVTRLLDRILPALSSIDLPVRFVLMGVGSEQYRARIAREFPELDARLSASGPLEAADLSRHLQICDLMIQPYPDGISARRSSAMALLAHGQVVVTTSAKATDRLWAESGAVSLSPVNDVDSFRSAVERLLRDQELRGRQAQTARGLYHRHFDLAHTVAKLRAVL